jgi:hypothetical protein
VEASASTAASAAGSELGRLWALAAALLVLLLVVGYFLELGKETRVVVDGPLRMPEHPASRAALEDELSAEAIQLTPSFDVEEPTTLELTLSRSADEGWVGVDVALIEEETGEMRQLGLATDVRGAVGSDPEQERRSQVLVDRVQPGRYVLRLAPSWEPLEEPTPGEADDTPPVPPSVHFRAVEGRRSHWALSLATALILLPPLVVTGRRLFRRWRSRMTRARIPDTPAPGKES